MSLRSPLAALVLLPLAACAAGVDADTPTPAAGADGAAEAPTGEAPAAGPGEASEASPVLGLTVGGACDAALETRPDNRCDGEPLLGVDLVQVRDADGDGAWAPGEALAIDLELFTTLEPGGDTSHVNYPKVFLDPPAALVAGGDGARQEVAWLYAVLPGEPMPVTVTLEAAADASGTAEAVFTVGALNCEGNPAWGPCPTPSPLRLTLQVD